MRLLMSMNEVSPYDRWCKETVEMRARQMGAPQLADRWPKIDGAFADKEAPRIEDPEQ
jgi:hypothetical protein